MYFEITTNPKSRLPISNKIASNIWLHRQIDQQFHGYKLGSYGGNYIEFDMFDAGLRVNFGFYKDFMLTQDLSCGILLSNIDPTLTPLSNSVISAKIVNSEIKVEHYNLREVFKRINTLSLTQVVKSVETILIENLKEIQSVFPLQISYSAGIDSGTLAWLAHRENLDFVAVIESNSKLPAKELPFKWIYAQLIETHSSGLFTWSSNAVAHFYQPEFNKCVGGFYGDLSLLHHRDLYYQSEHLLNIPINEEHYDKDPSSNFTLFQNYNTLISSIIKMHLTPTFRQWFDDFEIVDAYRDPRLFELVLSLNHRDLLLEFKTAIIQKSIINNIDTKCWDFLCDYKNDYSKFKVC